MPLSPWSVRSTAVGVLNAFNFGDLTQATINSFTKSQGSPPSPDFPAEEGGLIWPRRDTALLNTSGHPTLKCDWPQAPCRDASKGTSPRSFFVHPLVNDVRTGVNDAAFKLGPGRELYAQFQIYMSPAWCPSDHKTLANGAATGGMKMFCVEYGAGGKVGELFRTNFESEIVVQDNADRRLLQGYNGNSYDLQHPPGATILHTNGEFAVKNVGPSFDTQFQNIADCRANRDRSSFNPTGYPPIVPGPTYTAGPLWNEPPCRHFVPGWNVIKIHIVVGNKLYFASDGDYSDGGMMEMWHGVPGVPLTKVISCPWSYMWDQNYQGAPPGSWPAYYIDTYDPNFYGPGAGAYLVNRPQNTYTATAGQTVFPYTFPIFAKGDLRIDVNNPLGPEGPWDGTTWPTNFLGMWGGPFGTVPWTAYSVTGAGSPGGGNVVFTSGLPAGTRVDITKLRLWEKFMLFIYDYKHNCNPIGGPDYPDGQHPPAWGEPVFVDHPPFQFNYADVILSTADIDDVADEGGAEIIVPTPAQMHFLNNPASFH